MKKGTCKFYNGDHHNKCCEAGVDYRSVTSEPDRLDGRAYRKPCVQWDNWKGSRGDGLSPDQLEEWNKRGTCAQYQEPSAEEIDAYEAEMNAHIDKMKKAFAVIAQVKKAQKGKSWNGTVQCPVCGGKLHMTHAACNGHVWGRCETKDCVAWME